MRSLRPLAALLLAALALTSWASAKAKLPDWVRYAAEQPAPPRNEDDEDEPGFEVIWDEARYEVLDNGRIQKTVRYAIRILDLKERWRAKAQDSYETPLDSRPKISAWTLHQDGDVYKYKKSDEKETKNGGYLTLETKTRTVTVDGWNETRTGDVFAYEITSAESSIFTQYYWGFQSSAPVALSRLTVSAPQGWSITETYFDASPEKTVSGNTVTWEARNLPSKKWEPYSPSSAAKRQHMRVIITPPENSPRRFTNLRFDTWEDLANFDAKVSDPMAEPNEEITAKALELTKDAKNNWEKIQALGEYAKAINYEHVALDLGNGGGYTPRPASETFRMKWGDCKDKTTLLRSMLKVVNIDSYAVSLNATDNDYVDPKLPGPFYFDHCITAVQVDDSIDTPAVYQDQNLGRLLFIDPTWNNSPIGEIPFEAQGGYVVIGKRTPDPLVRLPLSSPEENKREREVLVELMPNGNLIGRVKNTLHGDPAVRERRLLSNTDDKEYEASINQRFALGGNPNAVTKIVEASDEFLGDRTYRNTIDFGFTGYAKQMQNVLMIFKPAILGRVVDNPFSESKRTLPVRLRSKMLQESAQIYIPVNYALDEFEAEIDIATDFGSYHSTIEEGEAELKYTRVFKIFDTTVPLERYQELQDFFKAVIEAEQTPVVLARKEG